MQAWTSGTGTANGGQWVQIRDTSATGGNSINPTNTINGFAVTLAAASAQAIPSVYLTNNGGAFVEPNNPGTGIARTAVTARRTLPKDPALSKKFLSQSSLGSHFEFLSGREMRLCNEDGRGRGAVR